MHVSTWNVALQTLNFLVLAFLLWRFLWRPVAKVIAERQAEVAAQLGEAAAQRAAAKKAEQDYAQRTEALAREHRQAVVTARLSAEQEAEQIRAQAERRAQAIREAAVAEIAAERTRALAALRGQAIVLAVAIVERLLREAAGGEDVFVDRAMQGLDEPAEREVLAQQLGDGRVEVVSASPLGGERERRLSAVLAALAGRPVSAAFRVDPAILAGVELRFPHGVWRSTWQASLARIGTALSEDRDGAG